MNSYTTGVIKKISSFEAKGSNMSDMKVSILAIISLFLNYSAASSAFAEDMQTRKVNDLKLALFQPMDSTSHTELFKTILEIEANNDSELNKD